VHPDTHTDGHRRRDLHTEPVADAESDAVAYTIAYAVAYTIAFAVAYTITYAVAYTITYAWIGGRRSENLGRFLVTTRFRYGWHPLLHWWCHR
jgi:hypothetical protein